MPQLADGLPACARRMSPLLPMAFACACLLQVQVVIVLLVALPCCIASS
jgi:hypothetical protein